MASDYSIKENDITYNCRTFAVKNNKVHCSHDGAIYISQKNALDNISYRTIPIYPYKYDENRISYSLKTKNCKNIIRYLYGPLYIDKLPKANMFLGYMYDKGICTGQDYERALYYYEASTYADKPILKHRVQELHNHFRQIEIAKVEQAKRMREEARERELERQRLLKAQKEERRRRAEEERRVRQIMMDKENHFHATCERDCLVNKYQFNTSCYKACMFHHGVYLD